jgi:branched-chain amino acid transport system ATP-binding protein
MLNLENVEVIYNNVILVLKGVSMQVPDGKIVSLLGANGAGKTTTLKAISGILYTELGEVTDGRIEFEGRTIGRMDPEDIVRLGIVQVMEGRKLFEQLTVDENLRVGAYSRSDAAEVRKDIEKIYQYFPHLIKLKDHISGYLSGGERQMVVMGRALMSRPKLMLLDEPSLGLSPLLVTEIFEIIRQINLREKTSILLV